MAGDPSRQACDTVDARDSWSCRRCRRPIEGGSRHHRQLRRFGDHSPANLVLLCGSGTTGCHGWVHAHPAASYERGWMVHSWHDPADVPVVSLGMVEQWVLFDREGKAEPMTADAARERMKSLGILA